MRWLTLQFIKFLASPSIRRTWAVLAEHYAVWKELPWYQDITRFLICLSTRSTDSRQAFIKQFTYSNTLTSLTGTEMFHITSDVWKMPFRRGLSHMRKGFWLKLCLDECVINLPKLSQIKCAVWTMFEPTFRKNAVVRFGCMCTAQHKKHATLLQWEDSSRKDANCAHGCLLFTKSLLWW